MKVRAKKILVMFGIALMGYFGIYFLSVRTTQFETHGQLVPEPFYRPIDGGFIQAVFTPAHLIDAAYLRPEHWEVRYRR
jgi:hypothetical protein